MKILKYTALAVIAFIVVGLTSLIHIDRPIKPSQSHVNDIANNLSYFKDSHGLCYATLGSQLDSGYVSTSITLVPCNMVGLDH